MIFVPSFVALLYALLTTMLPVSMGGVNHQLNSSMAWNNTDCFDPNTTAVPHAMQNIADLCVCPRVTICARNWYSTLFLVLARGSAYFDYPMYMLLFLTKAHNLRKFLQRTFFAMFLPLDNMHELHVLAGTVVGFEVVWHSFWHLLRWGVNGEIALLLQHQTGATGLACLLMTPLISYPMLFDCLKKRMEFESRKCLHYLSIVWGSVILAHAPPTRIFWLIGVPLLLYLCDYLYGCFWGIHHVTKLDMARFGQSVEVAWANPRGFDNSNAGYVYLCLPWVSKMQVRREWERGNVGRTRA